MPKQTIHKLKNIINSLKKQFSLIYQEDLYHLILFGSQARGDASQYSDIDILVILKYPIDPIKEIKKNINLISDICLEYDQDINCFYLSKIDWENSDNLFINNIKKEGIVL